MFDSGGKPECPTVATAASSERLRSVEGERVPLDPLASCRGIESKDGRILNLNGTLYSGFQAGYLWQWYLRQEVSPEEIFGTFRGRSLIEIFVALLGISRVPPATGNAVVLCSTVEKLSPLPPYENVARSRSRANSFRPVWTTAMLLPA